MLCWLEKIQRFEPCWCTKGSYKGVDIHIISANYSSSTWASSSASQHYKTFECSWCLTSWNILWIWKWHIYHSKSLAAETFSRLTQSKMFTINGIFIPHRHLSFLSLTVILVCPDICVVFDSKYNHGQQNITSLQLHHVQIKWLPDHQLTSVNPCLTVAESCIYSAFIEWICSTADADFTQNASKI